MIALAIRFLAGRFHATPWDRHTNEGVVEWPPSPWRILRSLVAASYRLDPPPVREVLNGLLEALAPLPVYQLPHSAVAHTRHYMPTDDRPRLVLDSFVAVGAGAGNDEDELFVAWPDVELTAEQESLLDRLLLNVGYLGRAESWVEVRRVEWSGLGNVQLDDGRARATERIRIKALLPRAEYDAWKSTMPDPGKKERWPETTIDVLEQDSGQLQKQRLSDAPGTQWKVYHRPESLLQVTHSRQRTHEPIQPTIARFAIQSAVLPLLTDGLFIAERLRAALIKCADDRGDAARRVFSGHDSDGRPSLGNRHAFYLPCDDDNDGRIEHLVVWAREGFDPGAVEALKRIRKLWGSSGHDVHLSLIWLGQPEDMAGLAERHTLIGPSTTWNSRTPFLLPRHPKLRRGQWQDTPEDQLKRLLAEYGLKPSGVERLEGTVVNGRPVPWFRFHRDRVNAGGSRASRQGFGFRIRFDEPVSGPIVVGYGAHMGLGQFNPG